MFGLFKSKAQKELEAKRKEEEREQSERRRELEAQNVANYQNVYNDFLKTYRERWNERKREVSFPTNNRFESISVFGTHVHIWRDENNFYMLEHPELFPALVDSFLYKHHEVIMSDKSLDFSKINLRDPQYFCFPLSDIKSFFTSGSVSTKMELTGGDAKFSMGDALVGGVIAGPLGAIAMGKTQTPYQIKTTTTDTRKTFLKIQNTVYELPAEDAKALRKIIPEKERK